MFADNIAAIYAYVYEAHTRTYVSTLTGRSLFLPTTRGNCERNFFSYPQPASPWFLVRNDAQRISVGNFFIFSRCLFLIVRYAGSLFRKIYCLFIVLLSAYTNRKTWISFLETKCMFIFIRFFVDYIIS